MVDRLFARSAPTADSVVLDPGCGPGAFIDGLLRWTSRNRAPTPRIVGVELDPERAAAARQRYRAQSKVEILEADFLLDDLGIHPDYVIGNPPYVAITQLTSDEKSQFKARYSAATGRFDLYMLFFERALDLLNTNGRLVLITPEKYTYVGSAAALRQRVTQHKVVSLELLAEDTFAGLTTYPLVSVVDKDHPPGRTWVTGRSGRCHSVDLHRDGASWRSSLHSAASLVDSSGWSTLDQYCLRISCGLATGADKIFVVKPSEVPQDADHLAWPTLAGRGLDYRSSEVVASHRMLVPYDREGALRAESDLGGLLEYLSQPAHREKLEGRTCARRKPWYAFHDSVPMPEILRPKILCKDITESPVFWLDASGEIVPRHTIYYIVPKQAELLLEIFDFLNGEHARSWIRRNAQRAANGFLRLQSTTLKRLPVPPAEAARWRRLDHGGANSMSADYDIEHLEASK